MADKDGMERKVFLLPAELAERMRAYQTAEGLPSEVETARRLINIGLQIQENVHDVIKQLREGYKIEKNIRALSNRILSHHILIKTIQYGDHDVGFELKDGAKGRITRSGDIYIFRNGKWENDDDEIPF